MNDPISREDAINAIYHHFPQMTMRECADVLAEYGHNFSDEIDDGIEIIAWMPLPKPWEGEEG